MFYMDKTNHFKPKREPKMNRVKLMVRAIIRMTSAKHNRGAGLSREVAAVLFALSLCSTQAKADTIFAKLVAGEFAYYTNSACTVESQLETPPATGIAGCVVVFGSNAEYQSLVPYTNELTTAAGILLASDVGFSENTDWSAFDFDLNGKTLSIANGAVLTIGCVKGSGTIQAPSVIKDGKFNIGSGGVIWASDITSKSSWKANGSVFVTNDGGDTYIYSHKNKPTSGNYWLGFWQAPGTDPNRTDNPAPSIQQSFSVPAAGQYYINFRYARYSSKSVPSGENTSNGSTAANAKNRKVVAQFTKGEAAINTIISDAAPNKAGGVMLGETIVGNLEAGDDYSLKLTRDAPGKNPLGPIIDEVMVYAKGTLEWKIPENTTYDNTSVTLKGEFLQVRKTGLGKLVMTKANGGFGLGEGKVSMVVEEGVVSKTDSTSATCGAQYSRIVVENGAQFDICGRKYWDYDYTLAGSGPDGKGALVKSNLESQDPQRAYVKATSGFLRNITLSGDTLLVADYTSAACDWALLFYDYQASTMTMNGHTLTIDSPAYTGDCGGRLYAGNMSFKGEGKIVIATNGCFQTYDATYTPSATNCELHVYGMLWAQSKNDAAKMSVISPVKSLIFHESGLYRNLRVASPVSTNVVLETYAPNARTWIKNNNTTRLHPVVQLGDADHLETTFDLSRWTTMFDDRAEGTLTFYPGTTVTVDVGNRTAGFGGYAYQWKTKPTNVTFTRTAKMVKRGVHVVVDDYGIRFKTGITIHVR